MNSTSLFIVALSICAEMIGGVPAHAAARRSGEDTFQQFAQAVDAYTALHRRLEQQVAPLVPRSTAYEIVASSDALAKALQAARVTARETDVFGADAREAFRLRIAQALRTHGFSIEDLVAASQEEADPEAPLPAVNARFAWARGAAMFPCVLQALPLLPEELQYRVVGRDLVLVDVHANLVADVLREVLH